MVGLDPLNKVAQAFDVGAIPFVVLIDAQGVIRSVHFGLTEGSVFAAEIDIATPKFAGPRSNSAATTVNVISPSSAKSMARVTTKEFTPELVMITPVSAPIPAPASRPTASPA